MSSPSHPAHPRYWIGCSRGRNTPMRLHSIRPAPQTQCGQTSAVRPVVHRSSFNGERPEVAASPNLVTSGDHYWIAMDPPQHWPVQLQPSPSHQHCHSAVYTCGSAPFSDRDFANQVMDAAVRAGKPQEAWTRLQDRRISRGSQGMSPTSAILGCRRCGSVASSLTSLHVPFWLEAYGKDQSHCAERGKMCVILKLEEIPNISAWLKIDLKKDAFLHATTLNPFFLRL